MKLIDKDLYEQIELAVNTNNPDILRELRTSMYANVRRAVAKNSNTPKDILEILTYDPVQNVSFIAAINPNNSIKKSFESNLNPCVICEYNENKLNCSNCDKLEKYHSQNDNY